MKDVPVELLAESERISPSDVNENKSNLILVDVRSKGEFGMCSIEDSLNFPFGNLEHNLDKLKEQVLLAKDTKPVVKGDFQSI
jgi:rhodanese-related sulfurtransferase